MLPAPTTTSPASSTRLDRPPCGAAARRGAPAASAPGRRARRPAAPAAWPPAPRRVPRDHTTAPKRRGSVRRSVPAVVTRSKWSCGPGAEAACRAAPASPTCPGAAAGRRAGRPARAAAAATGTCRAAAPRRRCAPTSDSRRAAQRPAQRLAAAHRQHARAAQPRGNAAPRDFDLGQFGHAAHYGRMTVASPGVLMTVSSLRRRAACHGSPVRPSCCLCHAASAQPAAPAAARRQRRPAARRRCSTRRSTRRCSTSC